MEDLAAISCGFHESHASLLSQPAITNPTFAGSHDDGDADLIVGRCFLETKATGKSLLH